ncbi:MAG: aldehyde dehydrogenase (NADP(+)) [Saprospiraceae bacterium]|nr:aldehyde dehydrogenase (NADP(+)) [Saprospiraceae bacterium]
MAITGAQFIGTKRSTEGTTSFQGINPVTDETLAVDFKDATAAELEEAVQLAEQAFLSYSKTTTADRARFLDQIADEILNLGDELLERCHQETALPLGRLTGERGRTMGQLKLFAQVLREGSWVDARIDLAMPERKPFPRSDIRHMLRSLGPVAVFGASNFPLAFSVAGGDTASALAAGCPVVVKGHPAHPGTSELVASAIIEAAKKTGMPEGVFSLLQGAGHELGGSLVKHPLITAVGFTGSFRGGKALFDIANQREVPIPVYAEMGSTNPVFILPGALKERANIAEGLASSLTLGVGQFCTNPGLVLMEKGEASKGFMDRLVTAVESIEAGTMLTSGIKNAFEKGIGNLISIGVGKVATGPASGTANAVQAQVFQANYSALKSNPQLAEEVFGPSSVIVEADAREEILEAAKALEGHLTATVHATEQDLEDYQDLFAILERKVGRIIINGFPTGVEVCNAMVHGGPYPATTAPGTTSVGTNAIKRFARPVCYQDFPQSLLPNALKDQNPEGIWRLVNGAWTNNAI